MLKISLVTNGALSKRFKLSNMLKQMADALVPVLMGEEAQNLCVACAEAQ